jgi:hypothetical protein
MYDMLSVLLSVLYVVSSKSEWRKGELCTYNDYEGEMLRFGSAFDLSPGWCGIRYTMLNVKRIVAVDIMNEKMCNKCLEIKGVGVRGGSVFVLAVDKKGLNGLDISKTAFKKIFPGKNELDPERCNWRVVDKSFCKNICNGSKLECTEGVRNLLPADKM